MLLELSGGTGALTAVIAVVGPRSDFVHEQLAIGGHEELGREQALEIELLGNGARDPLGRQAGWGWHGARKYRPAQDAGLVVVQRGRIDHEMPARAARHEDGQLQGEVELPLHDAGPAAHRRPRRRCFGGRRDPRLSPAVVAAR